MIRAVLFDRDGTLVENTPNIIDPADFDPMPDAAAAIAHLRAANLQIGAVTNQPRVGHGLLTERQLDAQHRYLDGKIGSLDRWFVCAHIEDSKCNCRKPAPGLVLQAAAYFGIEPFECVVVGDIASDYHAAQHAGAASILVPNTVTLPAEIVAAPLVAHSLTEAVELILSGAANGKSAPRREFATEAP